MSNADAIADFAISLMKNDLPEDVANAARFCIVDWFGTAIGAEDQLPIQALKRTVSGWQAAGQSQILLGGNTAPVSAALINGTMAHCLDFDDTHVRSIAHLSGPTFAAAFAIGSHRGLQPLDIFKAFVAGFEVGGRLGSEGVGVAINERHIHSTGVFGCIGASVSAGLLLGLDADALKRAIGLAASQVGGLTGSFGTSAKPFHAGKAALNGVLSAQMASEGYDSQTNLVEPGGGLDRALVQDQSVKIHHLDFSDGWEITRNTFKPYASCLLTHPVIDAGREIFAQLKPSEIREAKVRVNPLAIQLAGISEPKTPFEGKFSLAFCTTLSLTGHAVTQTDFTPENLQNPRYREIISSVKLEPVMDMANTAAELEVIDSKGNLYQANTPLALGNPGRPMSWDDLKRKFLSLTEPVIGPQSHDLFDLLAAFDSQNGMSSVRAAVARPEKMNARKDKMRA
jgi:2-methylcitrate dehydratase PrpD